MQRSEDSVLQFDVDRVPGGLLDDQPKQDVAGVAVRPSRALGEMGLVRGCQPDELLWRVPVRQIAGLVAAEDRRSGVSTAALKGSAQFIQNRAPAGFSCPQPEQMCVAPKDTTLAGVICRAGNSSNVDYTTSSGKQRTKSARQRLQITRTSGMSASSAVVLRAENVMHTGG
jgi:hypothetical protein